MLVRSVNYYGGKLKDPPGKPVGLNPGGADCATADSLAFSH